MLKSSVLSVALAVSLISPVYAQSAPATVFYIMTGIEPKDIPDVRIAFKETPASAFSKAAVEVTLTNKITGMIGFVSTMRQLSDCKFEMNSDFSSSEENPIARTTLMTFDFSRLAISQVDARMDFRAMRYVVNAEGVEQCLISNSSREDTWRGLKRGECRTDTVFSEDNEVVAKRKAAALKYLMDKLCKGNAF